MAEYVGWHTADGLPRGGHPSTARHVAGQEKFTGHRTTFSPLCYATNWRFAVGDELFNKICCWRGWHGQHFLHCHVHSDTKRYSFLAQLHQTYLYHSLVFATSNMDKMCFLATHCNCIAKRWLSVCRHQWCKYIVTKRLKLGSHSLHQKLAKWVHF